MKSAGFLNGVSDDKSQIRKSIEFSFIFAIRGAQIGENGIEIDKNDRKFNLPGGLTAVGLIQLARNNYSPNRAIGCPLMSNPVIRVKTPTE